MKYGKLTILKEGEGFLESDGRIRRGVICKCECGNIKRVRLKSLKAGITKSCGCLYGKQDKNKKRLSIIFSGIKQRCYNKNNKAFKNYGGRGIISEWNSFEDFYNDMIDSYKEGFTLDRKDNDGNYCRDNCRWASWKTQQRNRRNNRIYKGISIAEWCDNLGLNYGTVRMRLHRGKSIQESLELI